MASTRGMPGIETMILDANVITVDEHQPRAEAVAIGQGRFVTVGTTDEIRALAGPKTEVMDLAGKTVVPGFIDAHLHALGSGVSHTISVDCDLRSIGEIQAALREQAGETPAGEWVRGFKFDDIKTAENRSLTRQDLDAASCEHPVFVSHRGGHTFYVNTVALDRAGVTKETADPPGGKLERDGETGELTGVVHERASGLVRSDMPSVTAEVRREGLRRICRMFNAAGLTSVHDASVSSADLETYQEGLAAGELTMRVYMLMSSSCFGALRDSGVRTGFGNEMLRVGGIKYFADGAIAGRTAWLSEPYEGSTDDCGIRVTEPEAIEAAALEAHQAGFQVCVHANGDAAIDMVLTAYETALAAYPRENCRHRIEHCTLVNPSILERMARLGCVATPFNTYIYHHGEKMKYYGEERLRWMFAHRSFLDSGIMSTGSTDYVPGPYEPLMGIQSSVTRTDQSGKVWGENQKVTVEEALRIYTLHGAYASFEEDIKGSIEVGKLADLVVLGDDPTAVDPHTIMDIPVEMTMVGGRVVFGG